MATDEMVEALFSELGKFAEFLDRSLNGMQLCMVYQTVSAPDAHTWTFGVCADDFDEISDVTALGRVFRDMERQISSKSMSMIERVVILRSHDPDAVEILSLLRSPDDGNLLSGHTIFGREIARAHVFIVHRFERPSPARQHVRA